MSEIQSLLLEILRSPREDGLFRPGKARPEEGFLHHKKCLLLFPSNFQHKKLPVIPRFTRQSSRGFMSLPLKGCQEVFHLKFGRPLREESY